MITYQDLLEVQSNDRERAAFVRRVLTDYQSSALYLTAKIGEEYDRCQNTTAMNYQKTITDVQGRVFVDHLARVFRSCCNFFNIFTTQLSQYELGNGVRWTKADTDKRLGAQFETTLQRTAKAALVGGVAFGFWNYNRLELFKSTEFAPLYDEENGSIKAGVRWWRIDANKPLRATFYELDGLTDYLWDNKNEHPDWTRVESGVYMRSKRTYTQRARQSAADGVEIYDGWNYPGFPIVPLWANQAHQSEIVGLREKIDAYDFIANGWLDDLDQAQLLWILQGAGGMDDADLVTFLERIRTVKAAAPAEGQSVQPVTVEIPVEARSRLLDAIERMLYRDAMILNPANIAGGASTATQIKAAYEPQNVKADQFEYCVIEFLHGILQIAGIDDEPTFTRSVIVNTQEELQSVISAATYLDQEYVTRKILTLLGDGDQAEEVLQRMTADAVDRLGEPEEPEE